MEKEKVVARDAGDAPVQSSADFHNESGFSSRDGARLMMFTNQPLLGYGVRCLVRDEMDTKLTLASGPVNSLPIAVRAHQPDILLLDLTPEIGVTILSQVRSVRPETRIIVMASALSWEMTYQLKAIGITGMLKRNCTSQDCLAAFKQSSQLAGSLEDTAEDTADISEIVHLSPREGQLVMLLSQGLKNKEMAQCLGIAEGTIRVYLSKLYLKIGVNDRFELALFGLRNSANLPALWPNEPDIDGETGAARTIPSLRSLWLHRSRARLVAGASTAANEVH